MGPALAFSLFPSVAWWAAALQGGASLFQGVLRDGHYNRYQIATANGLQTLSVPLIGGRRQRQPLDHLCIDYTHDWQRQHWGALYSGYGRAPYFEHFAPGLQRLIYDSPTRLLALNQEALDWVCRELRLQIPFATAPSEALPAPLPNWTTSYQQVFEMKYGFQPGLSILDLMMNEGPAVEEVLRAGSQAFFE